jgi:Flp pilus assembly protein TadG
MRSKGRLTTEQSGVSAVEFALIAPVLFAFIIAISQIGILYFANAGLKNAVDDGARLLSLYPRRTVAQVNARIADRRFGLNPVHLVGPTYATGTSNGAPFTEITMVYNAPLDFLFYRMGAFQLRQTRRVYTQAVGCADPGVVCASVTP